jgi:hypothetical protein
VIDSDLGPALRAQAYALLQATPVATILVLAGADWFDQVSASPGDWKFDSYVKKPFRLDELIVRIEAALSPVRSRKQEAPSDASGYVCARCQKPVSKTRAALLYAHRGEWFACETPWCDWVQIRGIRGQSSSVQRSRRARTPCHYAGWRAANDRAATPWINSLIQMDERFPPIGGMRSPSPNCQTLGDEYDLNKRCGPYAPWRTVRSGRT